MRITIIGGGAAGCFCAVNIKRNLPEAEVTLLEAGKRLLAKVAITGGGRCNITNSFRAVKGVDSVYPRGGKLMKRLLKVFSHTDAYQWFEDAGIALMTQENECVFPVSQDAMQVVRTLEGLLMRHGVKVIKNHKVTDITEVQKEADAVVVTVGGKPKQSGLDFLSPLGIECVTPVPSLFTFNLGDKALHELMGTVVENVTARLSGTKMTASGPLLITHWGLSGPAILKLSSYGARYLAEQDYKAEVAVNWFGTLNEDEVLEELNELASNNAKRQLTSAYPRSLFSATGSICSPRQAFRLRNDGTRWVPNSYVVWPACSSTTPIRWRARVPSRMNLSPVAAWRSLPSIPTRSRVASIPVFILQAKFLTLMHLRVDSTYKQHGPPHTSWHKPLPQVLCKEDG